MSLAHCYSHGKGVEVDFDKAFLYHEKAADMGKLFFCNVVLLCSSS